MFIIVLVQQGVRTQFVKLQIVEVQLSNSESITSNKNNDSNGSASTRICISSMVSNTFSVPSDLPNNARKYCNRALNRPVYTSCFNNSNNAVCVYGALTILGVNRVLSVN
jgi:hypothetical protein